MGSMGCAAPHPMHWADLRSSIGEAVEVGFLDSRYLVDPVAETIRKIEPDESRVLSQEFQILLIRYLAIGKKSGLQGVEITEKELPGGPTFFRGPHKLQLDPLISRFGRDAQGFLARGKELGGAPSGHGDASVRFLPFPEIPVTVVLWEADDEFPASVSIIFDRSIIDWFELDMVFILVRQLILRIASLS